MPEDDHDKQKVVAIADLPRTRSDRFVSAYANHTEASPGFYEIDLLFSRIAKTSHGKLGIEEEVDIILSWEHALRVRDLLIRMIDAYEAQQGKIRLQEIENQTSPDAPDSSK